MNINLSNFILKCDNNDCGQNEEHVCCVSCKSFNECIQKDWICLNLENGDDPSECSRLYLRKSTNS